MNKTTPGFSASGRGFHIHFPNGLTISTQFGGGNYCANRDRLPIGAEREMYRVDCENAEVAIFNTDGQGGWRTKEIALAAGLGEQSDDVIGWVDFNDWLKLFDAARAFLSSLDGGKK